MRMVPTDTGVSGGQWEPISKRTRLYRKNIRENKTQQSDREHQQKQCETASHNTHSCPTQDTDASLTTFIQLRRCEVR